MKKVIWLVVLIGVIAGCKEKLSYDYLIQHPLVLMQEVNRCQAIGDKTPDQVADCEKIMHAAEVVIPILQVAQADPEKIGMQLMEDQLACVNTKEKCDEVKALYGVVALNTPE